MSRATDIARVLVVLGIVMMIALSLDRIVRAAEPVLGISSGMTITNSCSIAFINNVTGAVSVDWKCVDEHAAKFTLGSYPDSTTSIALLLKAVREGSVIEIKR